MSRRLTPVKREQFIRRLRELGFDGPFSGYKHQIMRRGQQTIRVPNPHQGEISMYLLRRILRDSGISREEWLDESRQARKIFPVPSVALSVLSVIQRLHAWGDQGSIGRGDRA